MASPNSIRIIHFSDVHFGVENYGRYDPLTGINSRLIDFRNALAAACEEAVRTGVEIGIFTGDAYKARDPNQTHQREFAACLSILTSHGIPVVLLAGNHDMPNTRGRANAIEIFGALAGRLIHVIDHPQVRRIETSTGKTLQVAGLPYLTKSTQLVKEGTEERGVADTTAAVEERYKSAIRKLADECRAHPDLPTAFMGHFSVNIAKIGATQAAYLANEPMVPRAELAVDAFDYVALGHIHTFQDLNKGAQPPVVYSGSIERIDFGERMDPKGAVFANISRGHADYDFFKVPTRPFIEIDVDASDGTDDPTDKIVGAITRQKIDDAIVKLSFKLRSEDVPLLREKEIRAALQSAFLVLAISRNIVRDEREVRSKAVSEAAGPLKALEYYIDEKESLRGRKAALLERAEALVREVEG